MAPPIRYRRGDYVVLNGTNSPSVQHYGAFDCNEPFQSLVVDTQNQNDSDRQVAAMHCQYFLRGAGQFELIKHLGDLTPAHRPYCCLTLNRTFAYSYHPIYAMLAP